MNTSRTIEQLEATRWPYPEKSAPPHVHRCHALRRVPVERLTSGDLRALITQDIGLNHLLPIALAQLDTNPMLEAEHYPGDLLCATMGVGSAYWSNAPQELAAVTQLAERAEALIAGDPAPTHFRAVSKDISRFRAQSAA